MNKQLIDKVSEISGVSADVVEKVLTTVKDVINSKFGEAEKSSLMDGLMGKVSDKFSKIFGDDK